LVSAGRRGCPWLPAGSRPTTAPSTSGPWRTLSRPASPAHPRTTRRDRTPPREANAVVTEVLERLRDAQNHHDLDGLVACFDPAYRSQQPVHPDRALSAATRSAPTGPRSLPACPTSGPSCSARPRWATAGGPSGTGTAPAAMGPAWRWGASPSSGSVRTGSRRLASRSAARAGLLELVTRGRGRQPPSRRAPPPRLVEVSLGHLALTSKKPRVFSHYRSDRNAARISVANSSGSSQAAKWPPRSASL
jgi:hypothetical protein